ncbi:hypothetical protein SKAU_G00146810 [Synaphobranchus kaupii]|uniref:Uncharacterized protein n=1 Tax=Synaphobranchus kaupii TaxID=118154 RepID=A0A9Q1FUA6_SYNKA|nr:hypothetical protein SKAU_G00146810 [Synaphobranchus kaupii]
MAPTPLQRLGATARDGSRFVDGASHECMGREGVISGAANAGRRRRTPLPRSPPGRRGLKGRRPVVTHGHWLQLQRGRTKTEVGDLSSTAPLKPVIYAGEAMDPNTPRAICHTLQRINARIRQSSLTCSCPGELQLYPAGLDASSLSSTPYSGPAIWRAKRAKNGWSIHTSIQLPPCRRRKRRTRLRELPAAA